MLQSSKRLREVILISSLGRPLRPRLWPDTATTWLAGMLKPCCVPREPLLNSRIVALPATRSLAWRRRVHTKGTRSCVQLEYVER